MEQTAARNPNAPSMVFRDGLGVRCRLVRAEGTIEVLCLPHELSEAPSFESALRARVDDLRGFTHPSFTRIRSVERLKDPKRTLALISNEVRGTRVSELLERAAHQGVVLDTVAALSLVDQLTTAIAALHEREGMAHGALTTERLILTPDGKLMVAEYVLGPALDELRQSRERSWKEMKLTDAHEGQPGDVGQLGVIADELFGVQTILPAPLRAWVTRLLSPEPHTAFTSATAARAELTATLASIDLTPSIEALAKFSARWGTADDRPADVRTAVPTSLDHAATESPKAIAAVETPAGDTDPDEPAEEPLEETTSARDTRRPAWRPFSIAAALVVMSAGGFAAVHYRSSSRTLPVAVVAEARASNIELPPATGAPILQDAQNPPSATPLTSTGNASTALVASTPVNAAAAPVVPAVESAGWISVSSPQPVQVYENGALVGASDGGRLKFSAGSHQIDIVNTDLGYRSTRSVTVGGGKVLPIKISFPNGSMALNAVPWAEVWVDGEKIGDTPIASLSIAAGPHDVLFRHPDLGERRRTVVVTLGEPVRASVDMRGQ